MADKLRIVGRYEIQRRLGRGGMAVVHLARQTDLDRLVALKELNALGAEDKSYTHRFIRESRLGGALSHPNIVTVFDYFEHDDVPFIAMEYVERGSLRPYLGRMTLAQIAGVLEGILAGLAHAEKKGIVHRDLKPENVLVGPEGRVKLADFGIAKAIDQVSPTGFLTATGMSVGTPAYMAPEQAAAATIDARTDLYAVGCMSYEFFTGAVPFGDANSQMALLVRRVYEDVPSVLDANSRLPGELAGWIDDLLARDPDRRPASASDAFDALEDIVLGLIGPRWRRSSLLPELVAADDAREPPSFLQGPPTAASRRFAGAARPDADEPAADVRGARQDAAGSTAPSGVVTPPPDERVDPVFGGAAVPGPYTPPPSDAIPGPYTPPPADAIPGPDRPLRDESTGLSPGIPPLSTLGGTAGGRGAPAGPAGAGARRDAAALSASGGRSGSVTTMPAPRARRGPSEITEAIRARPPRAVRRRLLVAPAVVCALLGAVGYLAAPPRERSVALRADQPAAGAGLRFSVPAGWRTASASAVAIEGLRFRQPVIRRPPRAGRDQAVMAGYTSTTSATLLPAEFLRTVTARHAKPERVKLATGLAYRYDGLRQRGSAQPLTLYLLPTSAGVATLACRGRAGSTTAKACGPIARTLTVDAAHIYSPPPRASFVHGLNGALTQLARDERAINPALRNAHTAKRLSIPLRAFQHSYARTRKSIGKLDIAPFEEDSARAIQTSLGRLERLYATLAEAAAHRQSSRYRRAQGRVPPARSMLVNGVAGLRALGYRLTTKVRV